MQVATLGQLLQVLTPETRFDGKYRVVKAERSSTRALEHLGYDECSDPCQLRLTLQELGTTSAATEVAQKAFNAMKAMPHDLALLVGERYVFSITVLEQGLHLELEQDSNGDWHSKTKDIAQCNALWRFGTEFWEKELHGIVFDPALVCDQIERALLNIRKQNPHYKPRLLFVWTNKWRCMAPKAATDMFRRLCDYDYANKPGICASIDGGHMRIFHWDGKTLASLFAPNPDRVLALY
jgi:hypothetical protein